MTRDIRERLAIFGLNLDVKRVALNMDQVQQYSPPPNPAKVTDSRFDGYMLKYGEESWELDALEPTVLDAVITSTIQSLIDRKRWKISEEVQQDGRQQVAAAARQLRERGI